MSASMPRGVISPPVENSILVKFPSGGGSVGVKARYFQIKGENSYVDGKVVYPEKFNIKTVVSITSEIPHYDFSNIPANLSDRSDPAVDALYKALNERGFTLQSTKRLLDTQQFPTQAPERWQPRGKELPEDFAVRVYGAWMKPDNTGISMAEVLHLDEPLWNALRRSPRTEKPEGFHLPSKKERNDAVLKLVASGEREPPSDFKAMARLESLARQRGDNFFRR
jgi:hypothetical protein